MQRWKRPAAVDPVVSRSYFKLKVWIFLYLHGISLFDGVCDFGKVSYSVMVVDRTE